jgi:hypothetical protein
LAAPCLAAGRRRLADPYRIEFETASRVIADGASPVFGVRTRCYRLRFARQSTAAATATTVIV